MSLTTTIQISPGIIRIPNSYRESVANALVICGDYTENKTKQTNRFIDRTGGLRSSIKRARVNVREMFVEVFAGKDYGLYVNDGTRYIRPRRFMEEGVDKAGKKFEQIFISQFNKDI